MKGNEQVIEALNAGLTIELTAINTYFIHSKMLRNWGLNKLADYYYAESMEEMKHADEVIDRILFLDGIPAISRYDVINVGDSPKEQIENGVALEIKATATYNEGIKLCSEVKDNASREFMERMVIESEQSIDWAEAQLDLIKMVGIENYLAQQMEGGGK
ncbi:MAG: bacterioferritin [Verrucomicrobiota bacterium]|nr:bacterioferritin [Verrucomicrobiota bacterium]